MSTDTATHRLTVRDLDPDDVAALKAAAAAAGQSLNAYLRELLHTRARAEHNRAVLDSLPTEPAPALVGLDPAADVRALRDERDAHDGHRGPNR